MKRLIILAALIAIVVLAVSSVSMAATQKTNNLQVTTAVAAKCDIKSVTDIAFGDYDPTSGTPDDQTGDITLKCAKKTMYKLFITGTRQMVGTTYAENLNFEIYSDGGHSTVFPSTNGGAAVQAPSSADIPNALYGRIPISQDVSVDTYAKTLVATVEY